MSKLEEIPERLKGAFPFAQHADNCEGSCQRIGAGCKELLFEYVKVALQGQVIATFADGLH